MSAHKTVFVILFSFNSQAMAKLHYFTEIFVCINYQKFTTTNIYILYKIFKKVAVNCKNILQKYRYYSIFVI